MRSTSQPETQLPKCAGKEREHGIHPGLNDINLKPVGNIGQHPCQGEIKREVAANVLPHGQPHVSGFQKYLQRKRRQFANSGLLPVFNDKILFFFA
jgi:hypothetical protein